MRDYRPNQTTFTESFRQSVYDVVASIPYGKVITYGDIARLLGLPTYSRLVGRAMKTLPEANQALPSHRVVNAQGGLVPGWPAHRMRLLREGVTLKPNGKVDLYRHRWNYLKTE